MSGPARPDAATDGGHASYAHTRVPAYLTERCLRPVKARSTAPDWAHDQRRCRPGTAGPGERRHGLPGHPPGGRPAGDGRAPTAPGGTPRPADYYAEHGAFLGDADFVWGPEGLRESEAHLLGDLAVGGCSRSAAGAGQGARWVAGQGAPGGRPPTCPAGMLERARGSTHGRPTPAARSRWCSATRPPCPSPTRPSTSSSPPTAWSRSSRTPAGSCARPPACCGPAAGSSSRRRTRSAGRCPTTRASRACACASPTSTARPTSSRTPPAQATYVEHHRTLGDRVREIAAAGLRLVDLVEPEWPESNLETWAGWSPAARRADPRARRSSCAAATTLSAQTSE